MSGRASCWVYECMYPSNGYNLCKPLDDGAATKHWPRYVHGASLLLHSATIHCQSTGTPASKIPHTRQSIFIYISSDARPTRKARKTDLITTERSFAGIFSDKVYRRLIYVHNLFKLFTSKIAVFWWIRTFLLDGIF